MPLKAGKKNMGYNIKEMLAAGHPRKQAIAVAYKMARKRDGGFYGHMSVSSIRHKSNIKGGC